MKLGIVATHESAQPHVEGLAAAAAERGWDCRCFLTESGVKLARSTSLAGLAAAGKLRLDLCEHSWHHYGGADAPAGANMGTQFQNAQLAGECDRIVVIGRRP